MIRMRLGSTVGSRPAACRKKWVRGGKIRPRRWFRDGTARQKKSHAETRRRRGEPRLARIDKRSGMDIPFTEDGWPRGLPDRVGGDGRRATMRGNRHALRRVTRPELRRTAGSHPRIVRRADVWGGKAVVAGTRVPVFMVDARLQSGWRP